MSDYAAALRDALACDEVTLCAHPDTEARLRDLLSMFEDYPGDAKADVLARSEWSLSCGNCELTWQGFFLPMSSEGPGLMATIRLAVCPRCFNNKSIHLAAMPLSPPAPIQPTPLVQETTR